jgi:hypothetical protein
VNRKIISGKERIDLQKKVAQAFASDDINGWEMEFLTAIEQRMLKHKEETEISENEQFRLDQIFMKLDVYRQPRSV